MVCKKVLDNMWLVLVVVCSMLFVGCKASEQADYQIDSVALVDPVAPPIGEKDLIDEIEQILHRGRGLSMGAWTLWPGTEYVTALRSTDKGLWCGTCGGLMFYDYSTGEYQWWTILNGLPSNHITSIEENDGDVWVGTQEGIVRQHDGGEWELITVKDGLVNDNIRDIAIGRDGTVWVSSGESSGGIGAYDGAQWYSVLGGGLEDVAVVGENILARDFNGNDVHVAPWVNGFDLNWQAVDLKRKYIDDFDFSAKAISLGERVCSYTSNEWHILMAESVSVAGDVGVIVYDRVNQEICRMEAGEREVLARVPQMCREIQDKLSECVLECDGKNIFLGNNSGLWQFLPSGPKRLLVGEYCNPSHIYHLNELTGGNILIHGYNTYYMLAIETGVVTEIKDAPKSLSDLTLPYIDLNRSVIFRWSDGVMEKQRVDISQSAGRISTSVTFLMKDGAGREWFWGYDGVAVLEQNVLKWHIKSDPYSGIRDASCCGDRIILATNKGVVSIDIRSGKVSTIAAEGKNVFSVFAMQDSIWFGVPFEGIWRCDATGESLEKWMIPGMNRNRYNGVIRDISSRGNTLFLATNSGVFQFDFITGSWRRWTSEFADAVLVDSSDKLWIGSRSGLLLYDFSISEQWQQNLENSREVTRLITQLAEPISRDQCKSALLEMGELAKPFLLEFRNHENRVIRNEVNSLLEELCASKYAVFAQDQIKFSPSPLSGIYHQVDHSKTEE